MAEVYLKYGGKIDQLINDRKYTDLDKFLENLRSLPKGDSELEYAYIDYYLGTGYGNLADHYQKNDDKKEDSEKYRKLSFFYLRDSIEYFEIIDYEPSILLSAYTNYANGLEICGRVIEALRIYRKALLLLYPKFGMALGNYGRALKFYANIVNDENHYNILHWYAYNAIKKAIEIKDKNMYEEAIRSFQGILDEYEALPSIAILQKPLEIKEYSLGEVEEKNYRLWCLNHHLFLNPLNDLLEMKSAFAYDPLTITQFTEHLSKDEEPMNKDLEPPKWFAMLNQLKEEYIYSRWLCSNSIEKNSKIHYADKDVRLSLSSSERVNYSIRLEQLKSAYKNIFSVFDKTSFIINEFWQMGLGEREAGMTNVFDSPHYPKDNIALSALYWSYSEFKEHYGDVKDSPQKDLKILRNALEHKFVKIHEYPYEKKLKIEDDSFYHISEDDLKNKTMRLLELAREWIMELVYAIGLEEKKNFDTHVNTINTFIDDYPDNWKI